MPIQPRVSKIREAKRSPQHVDQREIHRLSRIQGQLHGIAKMIEEKRYCPEILLQTRAVKAAIGGLETSILEKHLRHCVHDAFNAKNSENKEAKITELLELFRKKM